MPFGMMQLSPDTRLNGWDGCSGYHYSDNYIYGFSHTHLSGTGILDYGDILLMPTNPINNQAPGNWTPDRAGWCPGMVVPVRVNNLETTYSGSSFTFEYDFEDWTSDGGTTSGQTGAYYATSTYIVVKSNTEISSPVVN